MTRPYYLLMIRQGDCAEWFQEFGDFDRETVQYELEDYRDHDYRAQDLKIIKAPSAKPKDCQAAIARLNAKI